MKLKFWRRTSGATEPDPGKSISQRAGKSMSPGCMAGFFSIFLLAGLGFLLVFLLPAIKVVKSQSWQAVDCEVLASSVERHSGSDNDTYSIEVVYRYRVGGAEYTSDRYEFLGGSSSGYKGKKAKVDAMPAGSIVTCYVDPAEPSEAVMFRGFSWVYLFALMPLIFIAVGGFGMLWALRGKKRESSARETPETPRRQTSNDHLEPEVRRLMAAFDGPEVYPQPVDRGPIELEEDLSPKTKLIGLVAFALFWNAFVCMFAWDVWTKWRVTGSIDGCMTAFMAPFVLVGLGLIAAIPYLALALANPRPKLRLSRAAIPLGESAQLSWSFTGSASRLEDLRIWIEGEERATYRRGTNTRTSTETFAEIEVARITGGMPVGSGNATLRVPRDTMHSFDGGRNKIVWTLKLRGSITRWPDVITEFPLSVLPSEVNE